MDREEDSFVTSLLLPQKNPRPTVLVIDDDEEIRTTIQDVLQDQGFDVTCAAN